MAANVYITLKLNISLVHMLRTRHEDEVHPKGMYRRIFTYRTTHEYLQVGHSSKESVNLSASPSLGIHE